MRAERRRRGRGDTGASGQYWLQTLGCPKNQVDSDKLAGTLARRGLVPADGPEDADLLVVNTCAFIEPARQESVDTVLDLRGRPAPRRPAGGHRLHGRALRRRAGRRHARGRPGGRLRRISHESALFADRVPVSLGAPPEPRPLLRPAGAAAAGRGRALGLPEGGRGLRPGLRVLRHPVLPGQATVAGHGDLLAEAELAGGGRPGGQPVARSCWWPRTSPPSAGTARPDGAPGASCRRRCHRSHRRACPRRSPRWSTACACSTSTRPGSTDELIEAIVATGVPYFDLSLQHVSRPLLARMRRWGDGERFLRADRADPAADALATFRSSFILGYPGETEEDHDRLLDFLAAAELDWAGFFPFSPEDGTHALTLTDQVPAGLALERLRECSRAPGLDHRPPAGRAGWRAPRGAGRRPGRRPHGARGPRDRRRGAGARGRSAVGTLVDWSSPHRSAPTSWPSSQARRPEPPRRDAVGGGSAVTDTAGHTFGPSALATPANALTVARLLATPLFIALIVTQGRHVAGPSAVGPWWPSATGSTVAGPPAGDDPLGGLPRPAGRQGGGAGRPVRARPPSTTCPGCRSA